MLTDPAVTAGTVGVDCNVLSGEVRVVWWTRVSVGEVVAAHHAGEAVVESECECLGALVTVPVLKVKEERLGQLYNGKQNKAASRIRQAENSKQRKASRERQVKKGKQRKASRER